MRIEQWTREAIDYAPPTSHDINIVQNINRRAWEWFHNNIAGNFIFRLLGIVGRIRKIWIEIFGPEPAGLL